MTEGRSPHLPHSPYSPHSPKPGRDVSRLIFLNANKQPVVVPVKPTGHRVNYFKGKDRSRWRTDIPTSRAVSYKGLYKNIDLKVYGIEKQIEYDWVVNPGADPGNIRFQYQGVKQTSIDEQGNLAVRTAFGEWMHKKPTAYQEICQAQGTARTYGRIEVAVQFKKNGENTYGFKVGRYNKNYPLIIDPLVLAFSTYLGGTEDENIFELAVGADGSVYVAGYSLSADFPTASAYQGAPTGGFDGMVTRLTPDGTGLVYSTYLGGSGFDAIDGLYLDGSGAVYVGGNTNSNDFPLVNPFQATLEGTDDAFITKLSANGSSLLYSTYLGGYGEDGISDITLDGSGAIYVCGSTTSSDFPVQNAFQPNLDGYDVDGFITKLTPAGDSLVYSTYLGGWYYDYCRCIAVTGSGEAVVAGGTESSDFPTFNAYQGSQSASWQSDGFVTRLSADGSSLVYSTYLGSTSDDYIDDLALDGSGAVYVAGYTPGSDFPTTAGAYQTTKQGGGDAFVTKLAPDGLSLVYSTLLGGTEGGTHISAIAVDSGGSVYAAGNTNSPNFPVLEAFQYQAKGDYEAWDETFITRFNSAGSGILFSSYLGGYYYDSCNALAIDGSGAVYMAGWTSSDDFPTYNAYQENRNGMMNDGFVTKLIMDPTPPLTILTPNGTEDLTAGTGYDITWDSNGQFSDVVLFYSTDNGNVWDFIDFIPDTGTYPWTVPNTPSSQCLVKIEDPGGHVSDVSNDVFTISPLTIAVISPDGTEDWVVTSIHDITWIDNGSFPNVSIDYSIDGGGSWIPIATNIPNTNSYSWTIPDTVSSNCLVRVGDPSGTPSDTSNGPFSISPAPPPFIEVVSPNGVEVWVAGSTHDITWDDSTTVPIVSIDYSTDGGSNWIPVAGSITNVGSYTWTLPDTPSTNCLVKVMGEGGTPVDTSDAVFTIDPSPFPIPERNALIALYNSTNGDNWTRKDNWRHPSDPTKFNDPGTECTWRGVTCNIDNTHVEEINLSNNYLSGSIPDLGALTALKKLNLESNNLYGNIPATLNNLTQLVHLSLGLNNLSGTLPDLGALTQLTWFALVQNNLSGSIPTWLNNLSNLEYLFFSINSFSGPIPDLSGLTSIKSLSFGNNNLTGTIPTWINNLVTLESLGLSINQLTGTIPDLSNLLQLESLYLSTNQLTGTIPTWINNLTQLKFLHLYENQLSGPIPDLSNLTELLYLQLNDNQLTGPIPNLAGCTQLSRLYLSNNQLSGSIPAELGQLTSLYYLYLNGNQLTGSLPGSLSNLTNLSNTHTDFRWNGVYTDDQGLRDFLNSKQIGGDWESTQTIAPTGVSTGEITETSIKVSWTPITYQGDSGGYNVYYSTTSGSGYVLAGTTADKTVNSFTVTGLTTNTIYYFVVETFSNSHADNQNTVTSEYSTEVSAATLESRTITIITPNGTESWEGNTTEAITWNSIGPITDVKIEYSTDNGATWNTAAASTPNSGTYDWTVPNTPSGNCLVKITDIASSTTDTSDGVFTILEQRTVTVMSPNGTEEWFVGYSYDITWTSTGAVGTVAIDYSIDNGSSWNSIISSTGNTGTYNWTVANTPSTACLVRISDTAGPAVDISNGVFTISPRIPQAERDALIALYNSTNGDSWYTNSNWRKPGDPLQFNDPGTEPTWYGVTCNAEKNHVLEVNLYQNGLGGTIPDLSGLTELITLNLGYNQLTGNIPSSLNNLSQLTVLNLKINQLDGAIPDLSNLSNLVELYLSNNYFFSSIPSWLNNFNNLTVLHLQDNSIYGPIPDLSNLTNLSNLNFSNNQLIGDIPAWLNNFTGLTELWLYSNYLSGVIPGLSNLTQLTLLSLAGNSLTGVIPASLNNLTNLQQLYLSDNSLSGPLPDLSNLTQLVIFSAMENDLNGSIDNITVLTQLQLLYLNENQFSGTIPAGLGDLTNLNTLHLDGNMLTGEIPGTLSNLTNINSSNLELRWNGLYTGDPDLRDFLNSKQYGGNWESTQTIAPIGISTGEETHDSVKVSWTPIQYQYDSGGYRVYYSTTSGSNYQLAETINDKTADNFTVTGLAATTTYYFVVESFTDPHTDNENTVTSKYSTEVSASTLEQPTLAITAPNGGQSWEATTSQIITWNSTGNITDVKIEYSTDTGSSWNTVIASTSNNGSYNWTVPNTPSSNCLVKIADIGGLAEDTSDAVFIIAEQRTLTVTAPNGTENWEGGSNQNITWNSTGSIANVMIEYSTDSGSSWSTITGSTANSGSYNWTVPNTPSANCLVRITDTAGPASDTSDAVFTITEQRTVTVTVPNDGESWQAGTIQTITWMSTGNIINVRLEYSTDGGGSWNSITSSTINSGSFSWDVPNDPSDNCLVKISDTASPAWDESDAVFSITPPAISSTERDALIALYNSTDGDNWTDNTNWRKPGEPTQFNDPGTEHTWYGVKCDAGNTYVTGINLLNNNLVGTIPVEMNNLIQITNINLGWNQLTGNIPNLGNLTGLTSLSFYYNQLTGNIPAWINNLTGLTSLHLATNQLSDTIPDLSSLINLTYLNLSSNQLTGTIPAWIDNFVYLSVLDLQNNQLTDTIPDLGNLTNLSFLNFDHNELSGSIPAWINNFTQLTSLHMAYNQLTGVIPDIGNLVQLTSINLCFNQLTGPIPTEIGTFTALTSIRLNENHLQGSIPAGLGNLTALRYLYLDENQLEGSIPPEIGNLTSLDYLYLKGNKLVGSLPGTLSNLTGLNSGGLELRWNGLYTADAGLRDFLNTKQSGGDWESTQTIAPEGVAAGNETSDSVNVSWNPIQYQSFSGGYRVYYSTTSGSGYTLADTTADKTVDNYTVTGLTPEQTYYFVVKTVTDSNALNQNTVVSDYSVEVSTATPEETTLTITAPDGGQRWFIDSDYSITWTSTGSIANVMIEYSTNNGSSWSTVISSTTNSGSYNWTIPNTPSTNCLVRISDTTGPAVDVSNGLFTIDPFPTLAVQAPNGDQSWVEGTTQAITWAYTGTIATVDIDYSANGGTSWNSIVSSTANTGSYNWVIPAVESNNCLVRVSDTATTASDVSHAVFTLWKLPSITVSAPNGGETWKRFTNQTITWDTTGNIQDVKIQYSRDAGSNWTDVVASTPNDGSYLWKIPNTNKDRTQCLVKIMTLDGTVVDTSDNYFTISKF